MLPNAIRQNPVFTGPFAQLLADFVREKRASGYKYNTEVIYLLKLGMLLEQETVSPAELPKAVAEKWMAKLPNEHANTHCGRICILKQFSLYLVRRGIPAYIPPLKSGRHSKYGFVPRIFTHEEIRRMFEELDNWRHFPHLPYRHVVMPELFRLLYGCGLRVGEALNLKLGDVDLAEGVFTIRGAKFGKERLVPMAQTLTERLRNYSSRLGTRSPDAPFFPGTNGRHMKHGVVYTLFREVLWKMGIPHVGRNHGPRIHDLRHTFAAHRLLQWYREGADLNAMLPRLSTYLGHCGMEGTQRYLHLVEELLPEINERLECSVGHVIPGGNDL